jgi:hypothetical protein
MAVISKSKKPLFKTEVFAPVTINSSYQRTHFLKLLHLTQLRWISTLENKLTCFFDKLICFKVLRFVGFAPDPRDSRDEGGTAFS